MTTPQRTRFSINLAGFTAELEGERTFVEDLYRKIVRDVGPLIAAGSDPQKARREAPKAAPTAPRGGYTWVYLTTHLFNKVYVIDHTAFEASVLGRYFDVRQVRRVYLNAERTAQASGLTAGSRTLWAEFTEEGKALLRKTGDTQANQAIPRR